MRRSIRRIPRKQEEIFKIKTDSNFIGLLRLGFLGILILAQVAILILLSIWVAEVFIWYLVITAVLSILCALSVIVSDKNSLSKTVWILFLLVFFPVSFIVYILASDKLFFRGDKKKYQKIFDRTEQWIPKGVENDNEVAAYLKNAGGFEAYQNTKLTYFDTGAKLFDDVLTQIANAKKYVFIEFFIFSDGRLLNRILNLVEPKIKEGLEVRIIYDSFGSHAKLKDKTYYRMIKMGIHVYSFNKLTPILTFGQNYRDHRKYIIVDGKVAYTGGANLADEYTNEKRMYGYWKDEGIKVEGEAVDRMILDFLRHYEFVSRKHEDFSQFMNLYEKQESKSLVVPYVDGLDYPVPIGKNAYLKLMMSAKKRLYIMTPYFVGDDPIYDVLKNKAMSGVDVRIILPDVPDKPLVYMVSMANAEALLKYGIKIYTLNNCFVHSKVMLSDDETIIGSINIDMRSFYQQFESAVYTDDKEIIRDVNEDFQKSFEKSTQIKPESAKKHNIFFRFFAIILQCWSPLM